MNAPAPAVGVTVSALTVDCADPASLADFWGKVLGRPVSPDGGPGMVVLDATDQASGPRMFFVRVPEPKTVKNRLHLDLLTEQYEQEIERLTGLGAKALNDIKLPTVRWTTFADPEGNEFDLLTFQSA